jgi:hypothetical protein
MLDQQTEIARLLKLARLANKWRLVEPNPSAARGKVTIENEPGVRVEVPLSVADLNEIVDDETKISRLTLAVTLALLLAHVMGTDTPRRNI